MENSKKPADFENAEGEKNQQQARNEQNGNLSSTSGQRDTDQPAVEKAGPDGFEKQMEGTSKSFDRDQEAIDLGLDDGDLDNDVRSSD